MPGTVKHFIINIRYMMVWLKKKYTVSKVLHHTLSIYFPSILTPSINSECCLILIGSL